MAMVELDKQEYNNKAEDLLAKRDIYRPLVADHTNKYKNKLINILKTIKARGGLGDITYKRLYPTGAACQNSMGYPKSIKRTAP